MGVFKSNGCLHLYQKQVFVILRDEKIYKYLHIIAWKNKTAFSTSMKFIKNIHLSFTTKT
jgi:hypothetical protein